MPRRYYLLLTAATLVAAFLRLWQITQVPPGLHYDLAATALLGSEVAFNGYRPIFISAYTGHEALFYYWLALWFHLVGSSIFSLRLAAAMLGVLAVPATFFALRETLRFEDADSQTLAALGAAFLATAFFHVTFSRFGFRAIAEPVVQSLALGFLFRGLHQAGQERRLNRPRYPFGSRAYLPYRVLRLLSAVSSRLPVRKPGVPALKGAALIVGRIVPLRAAHISILLAGVLTGLDAYTYLAARLFPVPLLVFWIALLAGAISRGRTRRQHGWAVALSVNPNDGSDAAVARDGPRLANPSQPVRRTTGTEWPSTNPSVSDAAGQPPIPSSRAASSRSPLSLFLLFSLASVVTITPLAVYFLEHPQDFINRAAQVAPRPGETALVLAGVRRAAEMIFINGEPYDRYNLPGLPLLGPVLGFCFIVGLLVTLRNALLPARRARQPPGAGDPAAGPLARATEWMLLAWLPAMLLPTALAVHDIFPSNLRALGILPLLFVFPARGLLVSYRWLQRRLPGPIIPYAYPMAVVTLAALAFGAYSTAQDYFLFWAHLPDQPQNNDADLTRMAAYLNANDTGQSSVYVSAIHYRHPTLAYLAHDYDQLHWLTGGSALVIPAGRPALYLFARSAPPPDEWIAGWQPNLVAAPLDLDNVPSFRAYRFAAGQAPPLPAFAPAAANFGNFATLTGYRVITQTTTLLVDLRWQIDNLPSQGDYLPYARLTDPWGNLWSQSGGFSYPSEQWQPGDVLLTRLSLPLPAGLPPGTYTLTTGLYSSGSQTNLPHLAPDGAYAGERALVTSLPLHGRPGATLEEFQQANGITPLGRATILCILPGDNGALLGSAVERSALRQGEWLHLSLYWITYFTVGENALTITLGTQTLYAGQPVHGSFPFNQWAANQVLIDRYALKVPADAPPGDTQLKLTMSGGRCQAPLGNIKVAAVDRAFSPPNMSIMRQPPPGSFADLMALYGYSLASGHPATLTLVWHALAPTDHNYTVFIHVLDAAGQLAAQADVQPRGGAYPTSLWAPGEYVADDYQFNLPPGRYTAEVGLYLPETGARLPLSGAAGDAITIPAFEVK